MCLGSVTPFVGVWIEIWQKKVGNPLRMVTPFVGVWIEIPTLVSVPVFQESLPLWECGLKFVFLMFPANQSLSLPLWECGLKLKFGTKNKK